MSAPGRNRSGGALLLHPSIPATHDFGCLLHARRNLGGVVDSVDETIAEKALQLRCDVGLNGQHVGWSELVSVAQKVDDPRRSIWGPPDVRQQMVVAIGRDSSVGRSQHT